MKDILTKNGLKIGKIDESNKSIIVNHNHGFFSCCSVRLDCIVQYINNYKSLPKYIDSSNSYGLYKHNKEKDVTFEFFEEYLELEFFWYLLLFFLKLLFLGMFFIDALHFKFKIFKES